MRTIRFRAWVDTKDIRLVVKERHSSFMTYEIDSIDYRHGDFYFGGGFACKLSEVTLLQYTGLKDKNGKGNETYHKDILKVGEGYVGDHCKKGGNFLIEWGEDGWIVVDSKGEYLCDLWEAIYSRGAEVIGNIYEHTSLAVNKEVD